MKSLAQGHITKKRQKWDLNPCHLTAEPVLSMLRLEGISC